jgi:integrative and conjugative element protein (TIGR02256 family)
VAGDAMCCFAGYGRQVTVCDEVAGIWRKHRQTTPVADESFGVLMGTTSVDRREIWIEAVTTPMAHDQRARCSFALRDPGHQRAVCDRFVRSGGSVIYLGTWHTHPQPVPRPSRIDRRDWVACLMENPGRPLAFVVTGTESVRIFVRAIGRFRPLRRVCESDRIK